MQKVAAAGVKLVAQCRSHCNRIGLAVPSETLVWNEDGEMKDDSIQVLCFKSPRFGEKRILYSTFDLAAYADGDTGVLDHQIDSIVSELLNSDATV